MFLLNFPDGWLVIQSRGQYGFPQDYFSNKSWVEYQKGFGVPGTKTCNLKLLAIDVLIKNCNNLCVYSNKP